MKRTILLTGALALALAGFAYAGPSTPNILTRMFSEGPDAVVADLFDRHDADGSGSISREEATAYFQEMITQAE